MFVPVVAGLLAVFPNKLNPVPVPVVAPVVVPVAVAGFVVFVAPKDPKMLGSANVLSSFKQVN